MPPEDPRNGIEEPSTLPGFDQHEKMNQIPEAWAARWSSHIPTGPYNQFLNAKPTGDRGRAILRVNTSLPANNPDRYKVPFVEEQMASVIGIAADRVLNNPRINNKRHTDFLLFGPDQVRPGYHQLVLGMQNKGLDHVGRDSSAHYSFDLPSNLLNRFMTELSRGGGPLAVDRMRALFTSSALGQAYGERLYLQPANELFVIGVGPNGLWQLGDNAAENYREALAFAFYNSGPTVSAFPVSRGDLALPPGIDSGSIHCAKIS